jgi:hypothetical protein
MHIKGFLKINSLLSNSNGSVSQIGELSPISYTFAREKGFYQPSDSTEYDLITFLSTFDNGTPMVLGQALVDEIIDVCAYLRTYINSRVPPYSSDDIRMAMYAHFPAEIETFEMGELTSVLPHWISWKKPGSTGNIMIWFHDEAFRNQYDEYEIKVVSPLPSLDTFFQSTNAIATALAEETMDKLMVRVELAKEGYPETMVRVFRFAYIDPNNPDLTFDVNWPVVIYGAAGDHIDAVKDAIIDYLENNSSHTLQEWQVIFPDIFKRTEFIIVPQWNNIAIPNMLTNTGMYSQVLKPSEFINYAISKIAFYPQAYVQLNTYGLPSIYKSLLLALTNGQNNVDGLKDFREVYPDYIPIPSTSLDFNRMSLKTQEMSRWLYDMTVYAEQMNRYSFLPVGMKRIWRGDKYYLAKLIHDINFVMLPKAES